MSLGNPILSTFIHSKIPDKMRATAESTSNMMNQLVMILTSLVTGLCIDFFGPQYVLAFGSLFGFFAIYFYQKMKD